MAPKAYGLLRLLVEQRPKALSKAQILEALWPGTFVSDATLAGLVADVRAALGDDARRPRFIRTLHGFGYAFCGSVSVLPPQELSAVSIGFRLLWAGHELPLPEGEHILGREESCFFRVGSLRVSRRHAKITVRGQSAVLEDLGSRNGTWLAGKRLHGPTVLRPGDAIGLGPEEIVFLHGGESLDTVDDVG